jgi:hypothetical protein
MLLSSTFVRSKSTRYFIVSLIFPSTPTPYITGTGTTNAKITSFSTFSGRSISLSGLYYFAQSDSFEPFVKLGVSAWFPDNKNTLQRQGVFMVD